MKAGNPSVSDRATELADERTRLAGSRSRWAADRTLWAMDRTLIAWIRTGISLIGFGVTLSKAGDALDALEIVVDPYRTLRVIGLALIALAVFGLLGAVIQAVRIERRIASEGFARVEPIPLGLAMAIAVLAIGVVGGVAIFL